MIIPPQSTPEYPESLSKFLAQRTTTTTSDLNKWKQENPAAQRVFQEWAKSNPQVVSSSRILKHLNGDYTLTDHFLRKIWNRKVNPDIEDILSQDPKSWPSEFVDQFFNYAKLGLVCPETMVRAMSFFINKNTFDKTLKTEWENYAPLVEGASLLQLACRFNALELVKVLLEKNADVNQGIKGWTPLHLAVSNNCPELVKMLLEKKAGVNIQNNDGWTPLHLAVNNNRPELVKMLLEKKADVNQGVKGWTPLHLAVSNNRPELVKMLLEKKANVNTQNNKGWTPLHLAVSNNRPELVKMLLEKNAGVNIQNNDGRTPLHTALQCKNLPMMKLLLEAGANTHVVAEGKSTLHWAVEFNFPEAVTMLLREGIKPDQASTITGNTPLHDVKTPEIATLLLEMGALIDARNKQEKTPLMLAAERGHLAVFEYLLDLGADAALKDKEGMSAFVLVAIKGHRHITRKCPLDSVDFNMLVNTIDSPLLPLFEFNKEVVHHLALALGFKEDELKCLEEINPWTQEQLEKIIVEWLELPLTSNSLLPIALAWHLNTPNMQLAFTLACSKTSFKEWGLNALSTCSPLLQRIVVNSMFQINPGHLTKGVFLQTLPEAPEGIDLQKLLELFDKINFSDPDKPHYRDPRKLTDDGEPTTPENLKKGLTSLINNIQKKQGIPAAPTKPKALEAFYKRFETLLKLVLKQLQEDNTIDPSELATHLIDLAIIGNHCAAKINELERMYHILSKQMPEGFEEIIGTLLFEKREGILQQLAINYAHRFLDSGMNENNRTIHNLVQLKFLLRNTLRLPGSDLLNQDPISDLKAVGLTEEEAATAFYRYYLPSDLLTTLREYLLGTFKDGGKALDNFTDWFIENDTDFLPESWEKERRAESFQDVQSKTSHKDLSTKYNLEWTKNENGISVEIWLKKAWRRKFFADVFTKWNDDYTSVTNLDDATLIRIAQAIEILS